MKTKLLKRLRKAAKKEYILLSDYPKIELHVYRSKEYTKCGWCDSLEEAITCLKFLRRGSIEKTIKKMKDEKLNKQFRKI